MWGRGERRLLSLELLPWVKSEGKVCWTYERGKKFVVKVKRM